MNLVPVLMVGIGVVDMPVPQSYVRVSVAVWLADRITGSMVVLVVFVMHMLVGVSHRRVLVFMLVPLRQV